MIVKTTLNGELCNEQDENGVPQTATELLQGFFQYDTLTMKAAVEAREERGDVHVVYHTY